MPLETRIAPSEGPSNGGDSSVAAVYDRRTPTHFMQRICSYCRQPLGRVECLPPDDGKITHGICPVCFYRQTGKYPDSCVLNAS